MILCFFALMRCALAMKIEMTLDCTFAQSRVTSVHSWYLTSFLILSFLIYPSRCPHTLQNTNLFLSQSRIPFVLFVRFRCKRRTVFWLSPKAFIRYDLILTSSVYWKEYWQKSQSISKALYHTVPYLPFLWLLRILPICIATVFFLPHTFKPFRSFNLFWKSVSSYFIGPYLLALIV